MKKSGIYTITNLVTNQIYVGSTTNIEERWKNHHRELSGNRHKSYYLQDDYTLYGKENFTFEILEECEERFLYSQEHYWCILLYTHNRRFGYNIARTNPNGVIMKPMLGKNHTDETKIKISKNRKGKCVGVDNCFYGKTHTDETKQKMSKKAIGRKWSDHTKNLQSERLKGKLPKNIEIFKMSAKGKKFTQERKDYISNIQKLKIFQFTKDDIFIKEYDSAVDAARELGFKYSTELTSCARGKIKTSHGYKWKYKT